MGTSMNAAGSAIYSALSAAPALTTLLAGGTASPSVYEAVAPQNTDPPYVIFSAQSPSTPQRTFAGRIGYENALYTVKGVTEAHSAKAGGQVADEIDTALDNAALTATGYTTVTCHRVANIDYHELVDGKRYVHRGGVYRLMLDPT